MHVFVISLDRTPERYAAFVANNPFLPHVRCPAVEGNMVSDEWLMEQGLFSREKPPLWVPGAKGCFLSHRSLWQRAVSEDRIITICEDDVVFSRCFERHYQGFVQSTEFDLMAWGYNLDMSVGYWCQNSFSSATTFFSETVFRARVAEFQSADIPLSAMKLEHCFGTPCYSVSPSGARKLLQIQNIRDWKIKLRLANVTCDCAGIDVLLNVLYPNMNAYVAVPPIAVPLNDKATTTIVGRAMAGGAS